MTVWVNILILSMVLLFTKGRPRRCAEMGRVPLIGTILLEVADWSIRLRLW